MAKRNYRLDYEVLAKFSRGEWAVQPTLGQIYIPAERKMLSPWKDSKGYWFIHIHSEGTGFSLARAIWIGSTMNVPEFDDLEVDHINEIKSDNRFENLRLLTPAGNAGRRHAALTFETAEEIRHRYAAGNITQKILGIQYGCSKTTIGNIIKQNVHARPRPQGKTKIPYENISRKTKEDIFSTFCVEGRKLENTIKRFKITRETLRYIIEEQSLRTNSAKHDILTKQETAANHENSTGKRNSTAPGKHDTMTGLQTPDSARTAPKQMSDTMTEHQTTPRNKRVNP